MNHDNPSRNRCSRLSTPVRLGVAAVAACFLAAPVLSNPVNPTVVNGAATFNQVGNVLTVTNSNGAIINWDKFSIKTGETTHFAQTSASSSVLNRVLNDPTAIYGTLSSNGRVWLVNPAGIMVGAGGRVDVAGFVASTLNISNADFLAGRNLFVNDGNAKDVINQGEITTPAGGSVYLIGSNVTNEGIITTPKGETILAAGATVSLIDSALPGVKVDITGAAGNSTNLGTITAEAGRIGIAGVIVRNSGTLNASSVVSDGGRIFLKATGDALVDGGRLDATSANGKGGQVDVLGDRVAIMNYAAIDVSGATGGGYIRVGGDYQGKNPDIQNASISYFGPSASLKADATKVGDGGTVIVWADDTTRVYGSISAKGGASGGNGGFVETSGKDYLEVTGIRVSTAAANGKSGVWLLDPTDITIVHSGTPGSATFTSNVFDNGGTATATLNDYDINSNLATNSITVTTSGGGGGTGDITVLPGVAIHTAATPQALTLTATRNIVFGDATTGNITFSDAGYPLTLNLNAGTGGVSTTATTTLDFTTGTASQINLNGGKTWDNNGTVNLGGASKINLWDGSAAATFNNNSGATFASTTTALKPFVSNAVAAGVVNNYGAMSINTASGMKTIDPAFNQSGAGSTLSLTGGNGVIFRNAQTLSNTAINLTGTSFEVTENHGSPASFTNVTFGAGGTVYVSGASTVANFSNVTGTVAMSLNVTSGANLNINYYSDLSGATVSLNGGTINMNCDAAFNDLNYVSGPINFTNGILGLKTPSLFNGIIPAAFNFGSRGGIASGGSLTVNNPITASGDLLLAAGWDGVFSGLSNPTVIGGTGITVNSGISATGVLDMRAASGGIAVNGAFISGGGASQSISSLGAITVTGNASGAAALNYTGTGTQTVSGANISVLGNSAAVSNRSGMISAMTGSQVITATGTLSLTGGGTGGYFNDAAEIQAGGSQTFNLGGNLTLTGGGGGYNNGAFIQAGQSGGAATQTFNFTGSGANSVTLTGGSSSLGGGFGPSGCGAACTPYATNSGAWIQNQGSGLQKLDFQAGTTNTLNLIGGSAGGGNDASINSNGSQWVGGASRPAITLLGGASGGAVIASGGKDYYMDNSAGLSADGTQLVQASSISMQSGSATYGGAFMGGTLGTSITVTGALSMTANGAAPASHNDSVGHPLNEVFAHATPVAIGDKVGTSVSINAASVSLSATTANNQFGGSPVLIGSLYGTANVSIITTGGIGITATSSPLYGSNVMIGSRALAGGTVMLNGGTGGLSLGQSYVGSGYGMGDSVSLIGGGGGLGQATGGRIAAHLLTASYSGVGTLSLPSNNEVDYAVLSAPTGDLNYNSNRSFHLVSATAGATTGVGITTTPGSAGKVFIGSITTTGNRNVAVNADGGIYDDNGTGVANISTGTGNITLTSAGGTVGDLAISTDTVTSGNIVGSVSGGASGGIYIRNFGGTPSLVTLSDSAANTSAKFYNDTTYSTASYSLTALNGGTVGLLSGGDLNFNGAVLLNNGISGKIGLVAVGTIGITSPLVGGSSHITLDGATINVGNTITTTGDVLMGAGVVNVNSSVAARGVLLVAGSLNVGNTGGILANNSLLAVVTGTANIMGGYIKTNTGDLDMLVGGDLNIGNAIYGGEIYAGYLKVTPYFPDASIAVGGNLKLNNGGHILAANDVYLDLLGSASKLIMNDGTPGYASSYIVSDIGTGIAATTHVAFTSRSSGGIVIDGIETTKTVVGGSGFFAVNSSTPATQGAGLAITYANVVSDLCAISPDLCKPPKPIDTPIDDNTPKPFNKPDPDKKASCTAGTFGCDDENKDKPDQGKDEKKDDKAAAKKIVQCGGF